jgi:DNA-binding NtrC family response regulator
MANILVVDKDAASLQWLQQKLPSLNPEFVVIPVRNVKEAIRNLEAENVDLVITELDLPGINGFELLAYINKHFSYLPVIVIADQKPADADAFPEDQAIFQYLPKPLDLHGLAGKILAGLASKVDQSLREVFLRSFLGLVGQQKKSYALIVRAKNHNGSLYFNQGELFEAETEKYTGLEAALEIISWKAAEVVINFETIKQEKKINFKLEEILWGVII